MLHSPSRRQGCADRQFQDWPQQSPQALLHSIVRPDCPELTCSIWARSVAMNSASCLHGTQVGVPPNIERAYGANPSQLALLRQNSRVTDASTAPWLRHTCLQDMRRNRSSCTFEHRKARERRFLPTPEASFFIICQHSHESLLRYLYVPELLHPAFALFLLLKQFTLS